MLVIFYPAALLIYKTVPRYKSKDRNKTGDRIKLLYEGPNHWKARCCFL